ncbi:MAG: histidine--tRNA ligase family protein [Dehalococcoidia bacterium]|nr:MAG: histidine--tRNA ligase family protein [Dehalococcoidia bacterium]
MKVSRCKGTRDLMPQDMARFRKIEAEIRNCCLGWGYREVRTPVLEYLHLFTSAGTLSPDMLGRVYSFLDWDGWSGERVVLRPDGTIPIARLYVENFQDTPITRLFYVENMFAFEGTGEESRERWQCGAELIGGSKPEGDVELISLALEALGTMGIDRTEIRLAHAGLLKTFFEGLGFSGEEEAAFLDQVFSGNLDVLGDLRERSPEAEKQLQLLFNLKGSTPGFVENIKSVFSSSVSGLEPSLKELARIARMLTGLGFDYQIDFASGRNFEYYTGIIFGFYTGERRLGGGGRYDELIPLVGGKDMRASGFALYLDELMNLIEEPAERERILVRVKNEEGLKDCLEAARLLRDAGYIVEFDLGVEEAVGFRWVVDMRCSEGTEIIDQVSGEKSLSASPDELLKWIGETECR